MKKKIDITVFGCEPDEAAVFHKLSHEFGVTVSLIREAVSENNAKFAEGCQCVSISIKRSCRNLSFLPTIWKYV